MAVNQEKKFCYRIIHRENMQHILKYGLVTKHHRQASKEYVSIGNLEIIDVRSTTPVKLPGYGNIGEYVPFYFTPRSIMLYNIITGYYAPKVPKRNRDEIIVIRCLIDSLSKYDRWFFTDGQANDEETTHYNKLTHLNKIDWNCIQNSQFSKSDGDYDRQRRYQAEFLVHNNVSVENIESFCVYNDPMKISTETQISKVGLDIPVHTLNNYFF